MNKHNRNLGTSGEFFDNQLNYEKTLPTAKQKKFYISLKIKCHKAGIKTKDAEYYRQAYSDAIDEMIAALKLKGIDIHGNQKEFEPVLTFKDPDNVLNHTEFTVRQYPVK